jgi:hypothetical protein
MMTKLIPLTSKRIPKVSDGNTLYVCYVRHIKVCSTFVAKTKKTKKIQHNDRKIINY